MPDDFVLLPRDTNQALGLGKYSIDFLTGTRGEPDAVVWQRTELFHLDSIACAVSAIACGTNAPRVLRDEALRYVVAEGSPGACCLGSMKRVWSEKAIVANSAAAREWDANGTNFGFNPQRGAIAGEFGHNDYYPVALAAAQEGTLDGRTLVRGMILLDEIRGRLAEVFALRNHKIDHVLHGAIASAATYGAMLGATAEQIESAIGMVVAHYVPFRAIRHGHQLSDSKGASAALSTEAAVLSIRRAMDGFVGPADIFRNPQAVFCLFEPPSRSTESPFDLALATGGSDFAVMGMHFKLGLYEHQSAGAIEGLVRLLADHPALLEDADSLKTIRITIYQPAFSIIGDPHKRDPHTRQSADHSLDYIVSSLLRKALASRRASWEDLMLMPQDYGDEALGHPLTRALMERIEFRHGGVDYDAKYPDGIPTTVEIEHRSLGWFSSGLVMYPAGHARNTSGNLERLLEVKFRRLASLGVDDVESLRERFSGLSAKSAAEIATLCDFQLRSDPNNDSLGH